jgi:hypothetical protein
MIYFAFYQSKVKVSRGVIYLLGFLLMFKKYRLYNSANLLTSPRLSHRKQLIVHVHLLVFWLFEINDKNS